MPAATSRRPFYVRNLIISSRFRHLQHQQHFETCFWWANNGFHVDSWSWIKLSAPLCSLQLSTSLRLGFFWDALDLRGENYCCFGRRHANCLPICVPCGSERPAVYCLPLVWSNTPEIHLRSRHGQETFQLHSRQVHDKLVVKVCNRTNSNREGDIG